MTWFLIFILELLVLFILSQALTRLIVTKSDSMFKSRRATMYFVSLLFLPGTFVHEMSHYLFAKILLIPTGEISIMPKLEGERINLGHVEIAKTDMFRRFLVGVSPFVTGLVIIFLLIYLYLSKNYYQEILPTLLIGFVVFQTANTMYSSKKDWEGAWKIIIILVAIIISSYILGWQAHQILEINQIQILLETVTKFLLIPLGIDFVLVLVFKVL